MKKEKPSPFKMKRICLGLTQYDISKLTGIAAPRISLFENGYAKLKPEEEIKLREALGMKPKKQSGVAA